MLEGVWKNDELNGKGILTYPDGSQFVAPYLDGEACGSGVEIDGWYSSLCITNFSSLHSHN
jgi:hypothetical protein